MFDDILIDGCPVGLETGRKGLDPEKPVLVLVHGSGGSAASWRAQLGPLSGDINVIAVDLPGHGESAGPLKKSVKEYADWVCRFLKKLTFPSKPFLCGASLGGAICLETAINNPGLINGLILIASGARLNVDNERIDAISKDYKGAIESFAEKLFADNAPRRNIVLTKNLLSALPQEIIKSDFLAAHGYDRLSVLPDIVTPTLVICGDQDKVTPPEFSHRLAADIPGARLEIIPEAGHMVMIENYREVNRAIKDFIFKIARP